MPMDTVSFRDLSVEEFDTRTLLAHANQQAIQRRYEDFLIVDVDGHHWEMMSFPQILQYIEDPVLRDQARYQGYGGGGMLAGMALGAMAAQSSYGYGYGQPYYGYARPYRRARLCVANQALYDDWGDFIGYRRVRIAC